MLNNFRKLRSKTISVLCVCVLLIVTTLTSSGATELERAVALPLPQEHRQETTDLTTAHLNIESGSEVFALCDAVAMTSKPCTTPYYYVNSGNSLPQVAQTLRKQKYESSVGYTGFGEKVFDYTNFLTSQVKATKSYRDEFIENGGTLAIHNHPSGQPFSPGDLYAEAKFETPITMVITDGYTYTLQPLEDGWGDPVALRDYYSARADTYTTWAQTYLRNTYSYSRKKLLSEPESPDDGSFKWFCDHAVREALKAGQTQTIGINLAVWSYNKALEETAQKFNLLYTRELTDEFDFTTPGVFWPEVQVAENVVICIEPIFGGVCCDHPPHYS